MSKTAKVFYGEKLAGLISETDEGYEFVYDTNYLNGSPAADQPDASFTGRTI